MELYSNTTQCPRVYLGYLVPAGNKYRNLALQVGGDSKIETKNMLMGTVGLKPEKGCAGDVQQKLKTTDPISSHQKFSNCLTLIKESRSKIRSVGIVRSRTQTMEFVLFFLF
jgi:hypothetical protein